MTTVWVTEDAAASLTTAARKAAPLEIGGVILGVERDGEPWVTRAVAFVLAERSPNSFVIPAGITPAVVDEVRREDQRLGYLGDWHSHPLDAPASGRDRRTLRKGAARRELETRPAVLLVVRATEDGWVIDALADDGQQLRTAVVGLTGPLPRSNRGGRPPAETSSPPSRDGNAAARGQGREEPDHDDRHQKEQHQRDGHHRQDEDRDDVEEEVEEENDEDGGGDGGGGARGGGARGGGGGARRARRTSGLTRK